MKIRIISGIITLAVVASFLACKGGSNKDTENTPQTATGADSVFISDNKPINVLQMNEQARATLEFRYKEYGKESYASIEMDRWYVEFFANGDKISRIGDGSWIDYYPDLTYEYGDSTGIVGSGRYHYNLDNGLLLMVDNDVRMKPKEYEVKISGPTMVLVGQRTYRDNHVQLKLDMYTPGRFNETE